MDGIELTSYPPFLQKLRIANTGMKTRQRNTINHVMASAQAGKTYFPGEQRDSVCTAPP